MPIVADGARQPGALRLGVHGVLPGQPGGHRGRRRRPGPDAPPPAVRRRPRRCSRWGWRSGGLAPSMPVLIAARFIQGLGGGAVGPTAYVAIGRCLPERLQPRMFAMLSTAWVVPGIIGPSLGGARRRRSSAGAGCSSGCCRCCCVAGGLALSALRGVPGALPPPEAGHPPVGPRVVRAIAAAAGAGLHRGGAWTADRWGRSPRGSGGRRWWRSWRCRGGAPAGAGLPPAHAARDAAPRDGRAGRGRPARP